MKKNYILYILLLILIFFAVLISWPSRWINLDLGNFHYHKLWQNPNLSEVTFDLIDLEPRLKLGMDFEGGTEYKLKIVYPENEDIDEGKVAKDTVEILRKRLAGAGFREANVRSSLEDAGNYYIFVNVGMSDEAFTDYKFLLQDKGELHFWGERGTEGGEEAVIDPNEDPLISYLRQQYDELEIDASNLKGAKVGKDDSGPYVKIALPDSENEKFTKLLYSYYGKSLIALLDTNILAIDGSALSEQVGLYGGVKTITLRGALDKKVMAGYAAVLNSERLKYKCEVVDTQEIEPLLSMVFLQSLGIVIVALITIASIAGIILYRWNGAFFAILNILFWLFAVTLLKVLPINVSINSLSALLLCFGTFFGLLMYGFIKEFSSREERSVFYFVLDRQVAELADKLFLSQIVFGVVLFVIGPIGVRDFSICFAALNTLSLTMFRVFLPFLYKLTTSLLRQG